LQNYTSRVEGEFVFSEVRANEVVHALDINLIQKDDMEGRKSFCDNIDMSKLPNARIKLNFVEALCIDGKNLGKIMVEDLESHIEYWQSSLIYFVLGQSPNYDYERIFRMHLKFYEVRI